MKPLGLQVQFRLFWVAVCLTVVASFTCIGCEEKKEFDYWQYVDSPVDQGDEMDMDDAGPDGSMDMDTDMGTDMDTDMGTDMDTDMPTD